MKTLTHAAMLLAATTSIASAGGQEATVGVGAEFQQAAGPAGGRLGGPSVNYDAGKYHLGGFLGFFDGDGSNNTELAFGARFYYHIHSTAMADFGIGGTVGLLNYDSPTVTDPDNRDTALYIEPGFQIRCFVASNVALSFGAGLSIGALDAPGGFSTATTVTGSAGVHYYFF